MKIITLLVIIIMLFTCAAAQTAKEHLIQGHNNYIAKNFAEAISNYSSSLNSDSTYTDVYYYRGLCYLKLNHAENAISDFSTYLNKKPAHNIGPAYENRGLCFRKLGMTDNAHIDFTSALQDSTCLLSAYLLLATIHVDLSQNDSALKNLDQIILLIRPHKRYLPTDSSLFSTAYLMHGLILMKYKNYTRSIIDFSEAIKFNSKNSDAYLYRGTANFKINRPSKAINDFTYLITKSKNVDEAYYWRGVAKISMLDKEGGLSDLEASRDLGNEDAAIAVREFKVTFK